jgi:dTDP-4-amino-4,6-dideoxygalactose transaminase
MAAIRYESLLVEQALAREYAAETERVLKSMGGLNDIKPLIRDFEKTFAKYIGVENAVAVNSGSDALKMSLMAAGVGPGDEVIVPNLTYQAVALAVIYCGATPVPVDALKDDLQIDPALIEKMITQKTKAIIAAHMFGRPCDVETIGALCREHKISFIEDVCQSESSRYKNRLLGSFGDMAAFSFSYYKPLSSCGGGGGMVVFKGDRGERIRRWMEDWRDDGELLKTGQRFAPMAFMDLIALRVKFAHLKEIIASRHKIKSFYEQGLAGQPGLTIFKDRPNTESVAQNFVVCCERRDQMLEFLSAQGIIAQKPYVPLNRMSSLKSVKGKFPVSDWYAAQALQLPLHSFMSQDKAGAVIECCQSFLTEAARQ